MFPMVVESLDVTRFFGKSMFSPVSISPDACFRRSFCRYDICSHGVISIKNPVSIDFTIALARTIDIIRTPLYKGPIWRTLHEFSVS